MRFDQVRQIDGFEFESGPLLYRRVSLSEGKVLGYTGFERGRSTVGAARFAQMIKFRGVGNAAFVDWPEGLSVLYEYPRNVWSVKNVFQECLTHDLQKMAVFDYVGAHPLRTSTSWGVLSDGSGRIRTQTNQYWLTPPSVRQDVYSEPVKAVVGCRLEDDVLEDLANVDANEFYLSQTDLGYGADIVEPAINRLDEIRKHGMIVGIERTIYPGLII